MAKPIAVLISDIHFSLPNLELASAALLRAQFKAKMLNVPLVIAGDLLDTKAIIRAEVANKLIDLLSVKDKTDTIILVGNHDLCNEKGKDHALNFLKPYTTVIDSPQIGNLSGITCLLLPYETNNEKLELMFSDLDSLNLVIMHQGISGSNMGDYIQDKSAIGHSTVAGLRVISGHYHTRQTIELPNNGKWDYIGNPYTMSFGEANDPEKGFQVLFDDGSLEFVPTNLRKHIVVECHVDDLVTCPYTHKKGDLLLFKCQGPRKELATVTKELIANNYGITDSFRLELIPTDIAPTAQKMNSQTQPELLDSIIDSLSEDPKQKTLLKELWREALN